MQAVAFEYPDPERHAQNEMGSLSKAFWLDEKQWNGNERMARKPSGLSSLVSGFPARWEPALTFSLRRFPLSIRLEFHTPWLLEKWSSPMSKLLAG